MASTDTLRIWTARGFKIPSSGGAQLDTRNNHDVAAFDAGTDEYILVTGILPQHYDGGGLTVLLHWMGASATSGDVIWDVQVERIGEGQQDLDSDGFASAQSVTATAPGTSGHIDIASVAFTSGAQMDSLAVGEAFRLKVNRDANNASDTMTGDAQLLAIELRET